MSPTMHELNLDRLSPADRIALAQELWESVAVGGSATLLTEAQRQELDRRLAEAEAHPDDVVPWERVKADALARFRK